MAGHRLCICGHLENNHSGHCEKCECKKLIIKSEVRYLTEDELLERESGKIVKAVFVLTGASSYLGSGLIKLGDSSTLW